MMTNEEEVSERTLVTIWTQSFDVTDSQTDVVVIRAEVPSALVDAVEAIQILGEVCLSEPEEKREKDAEEGQVEHQPYQSPYWFESNQSARKWRPVQLESTYG